jgi:hypothetical protein
VARGCARIDSRLDTAKICSDGRVDVDRPWLRAVFGGGKTFSHDLDPKLTFLDWIYFCEGNSIQYRSSSAPNVERAAQKICVTFAIILVRAPASVALNILQLTLFGPPRRTKTDHSFELSPILRSFGRQFVKLPWHTLLLYSVSYLFGPDPIHFFIHGGSDTRRSTIVDELKDRLLQSGAIGIHTA